MPFSQETIDKSNDFPALAMAIGLYADLRDDAAIPPDRKSEALDETYLLVEVLRCQAACHAPRTTCPAGRAGGSYTDRLMAIHESARRTCEIPRAAAKNLDAAIAMCQAALWHLPCGRVTAP